MKAFVFAFAVLFAGVAAVPQSPESRFIDNAIANALADVSQQIKDRGLDPVAIQVKQFSYKLPVTDLLIVNAVLENLLVEGLSDIVINNINFSILALRLRLDVSLPKIAANLGVAEGQVVVFKRELRGAASGSLEIIQPRVQADVRVRLNLGGVQLRSVDVKFSLGAVKSDISLNLLGRDLSGHVNQVLNENLPQLLNSFSHDINELLGHVIIQLADRLL